MASENIVSRLISHLNGGLANREMPDVGTRNMGGSFRDNQPYISGYFHAIFDLPNRIFQGTEDVAIKWLNATCEGFTPPQFSEGGI